MTKKKYVALARVSSREQEREGFSLEVQEEALNRYAKQQAGTIVKLFRIAETATKPEERRTFREFLAYAKKNARELTGLLFMKVDRAARNLFDYVELERLESECGLEVVYVTQPTENTPAGRMLRRTLANMASFYTEQQSVDVRGGLERRVQTGLFPNKAPYGYRNVRIDGRSVVQIEQEDSPKVRRIHDLYAYEGHTLDSLIDALRGRDRIHRRVPGIHAQQGVHDLARPVLPRRSAISGPVVSGHARTDHRPADLGPKSGPVGREGLSDSRVHVRLRAHQMRSLRPADYWGAEDKADREGSA